MFLRYKLDCALCDNGRNPARTLGGYASCVDFRAYSIAMVFALQLQH